MDSTYYNRTENKAVASAPFALLQIKSNWVGLRVEFLLETDSGYPKDAEVSLCNISNYGNSLHFNTHWTAPPVSAFARSGGFVCFYRLFFSFSFLFVVIKPENAYFASRMAKRHLGTCVCVALFY